MLGCVSHHFVGYVIGITIFEIFIDSVWLMSPFNITLSVKIFGASIFCFTSNDFSCKERMDIIILETLVEKVRIFL